MIPASYAERIQYKRTVEIVALRNRVAALEQYNAGLVEHNRRLCELLTEWRTNTVLALLIAATATAITIILEMTR